MAAVPASVAALAASAPPSLSGAGGDPGCSGGPDDSEGIVLHNLGMRFTPAPAPPALKGISAAIPAGRITGLVGPDAAGKTTLMRILAGLMQATTGTARIFGLSPAEAAAHGSTGYMPQRFGLYEDLSVHDNLALHARLRGLEGPARDALFARLLDFTSLAPFTQRLAGRLSGGMKQKLGIACALLGSPRLLLLDEPGVGVDPQSRRELWRMVQDLCGSGMTIVWSTAYLEEAERCPHVIMLDAGRTLHVGPPESLTRTASGRVFRVPPRPGEDSKGLLARWLTTAGVDDALIQGSHVRLVLRAEPEAALRALSAQVLEQGGEAVPPRLEDAYMSVLGGISQTPSPFAPPEAAPEAPLETPPEPLTGLPPANLSTNAAASTSASPALRIDARALCKRFGNFTAAHDISFQVRAGQIFGLLGPNGAGKSTTFRMLCGLSRPTSGQCFVDGVDLLTAGSAARSRLGYMAQKFSLYPDIPVTDNIHIFAELYGLSRAARQERIPLLVDALELEPFLRAPTGTLPLGQKQRLALLCATLHNPPVLFLDEPTSGVDARTRRDFWKHITAMTRAGTAVLVTTHFMEEAEYCDHIALIYQGGIISTGTPDELKARAPRPDPCPDPCLAPPPDNANSADYADRADNPDRTDNADRSGSAAATASPPQEITLEDAFIAYIERYNREAQT